MGPSETLGVFKERTARPVKRKINGIPLRHPLGKTAHEARLLETHSSLRSRSGNRETGDTAYPAPFFRNSLTRRRRGPAIRPGDARSCGYLDHTNLYPCGRRATEKSTP